MVSLIEKGMFVKRIVGNFQDLKYNKPIKIYSHNEIKANIDNLLKNWNEDIEAGFESISIKQAIKELKEELGDNW